MVVGHFVGIECLWVNGMLSGGSGPVHGWFSMPIILQYIFVLLQPHTGMEKNDNFAFYKYVCYTIPGLLGFPEI